MNETDIFAHNPELPGNPEIRIGQTDGLRSKLERTAGNAALGQGKAETSHTERLLVCVVSVRKRFTDPDNLSAKYVIDCLRYAGVIPDDSPDKIDLKVTQRRPEKGEAESTIVEVFRL